MNGPLIDSELFPLLERKTNKQTETFKPNSSNQTNKKNVSSGPAVMAHNDAVKPRPSFFEIHLPLPCAGGPWAKRTEGSKQQPESSEFGLSEISFIRISLPTPPPHTHLFFFFWEEAFFFPLCFVYGASLLSHSWKFNSLHLCAALRVNLTRVVKTVKKRQVHMITQAIWALWWKSRGTSEVSVFIMYCWMGADVISYR